MNVDPTLLFLSRQHSPGKIHITYLCTPAPSLATWNTNSDGKRKRMRKECRDRWMQKQRSERGRDERRQDYVGLRETKEDFGLRKNSVVVSSGLPWKRSHILLIGPFPSHPSYPKLIFIGSCSFFCSSFYLLREVYHSPALVEEEDGVAKEPRFSLIIRPLLVVLCFHVSSSEYMLFFSPGAIF